MVTRLLKLPVVVCDACFEIRIGPEGTARSFWRRELVDRYGWNLAFVRDHGHRDFCPGCVAEQEEIAAELGTEKEDRAGHPGKRNTAGRLRV